MPEIDSERVEEAGRILQKHDLIEDEIEDRILEELISYASLFGRFNDVERELFEETYGVEWETVWNRIFGGLYKHTDDLEALKIALIADDELSNVPNHEALLERAERGRPE